MATRRLAPDPAGAGLPSHQRTSLEYERDGTPTHYVYRAYSASGELLYVGCTRYPDARTKQHRRSPWWPEAAARIEWTGPLLRGDALHTERYAIWTGGPVYNQPPRYWGAA